MKQTVAAYAGQAMRGSNDLNASLVVVRGRSRMDTDR